MNIYIKNPLKENPSNWSWKSTNPLFAGWFALVGCSPDWVGQRSVKQASCRFLLASDCGASMKQLELVRSTSTLLPLEQECLTSPTFIEYQLRNLIQKKWTFFNSLSEAPFLVSPGTLNKSHIGLCTPELTHWDRSRWHSWLHRKNGSKWLYMRIEMKVGATSHAKSKKVW